MTAAPASDIDFYCDEVIADPYSHYRELRDAGSAVWLSRHGVWALARYRDVTQALRNAGVFSSARGCTLNEVGNEASAGTLLCSDDPLHRALRKVFAEPLQPASLAPLRDRVANQAGVLVDELVARGEFDAVGDLALHLPLTVVTELVGLSVEGRARMLDWASAMFDAFGPIDNSRTQAAFPVLAEVAAYIDSIAGSDQLRPGGWAARLFECADAGRISRQQATRMLLDYIGPALDTTINATSSAIWLFGSHPEQWRMVRANPALIPDAIEETLRLESPIRAFSRYVTRDHCVDDVTIPAGARALVIYASANRDERHWPEPASFDILRRPTGHVAFGFGMHACAGMHLARLEIVCLLEALVRRVDHFEILGATHGIHNTLRGLKSLHVRVHPV
jgi:cytochrome P450